MRAHTQAVEAKQATASLRASIAGLAGQQGDIGAIASDIGTTVIETELALLRVERRALKRVHDFALKHASVKKGE